MKHVLRSEILLQFLKITQFYKSVKIVGYNSLCLCTFKNNLNVRMDEKEWMYNTMSLYTSILDWGNFLIADIFIARSHKWSFLLPIVHISSKLRLIRYVLAHFDYFGSSKFDFLCGITSSQFFHLSLGPWNC